MKISVKVKARSKIEHVEKMDDSHYVVSVKAPPVDGRANEAVIAVLATYFAVPRNRVRLVSGRTARQKVFEVFL